MGDQRLRPVFTGVWEGDSSSGTGSSGSWSSPADASAALDEHLLWGQGLGPLPCPLASSVLDQPLLGGNRGWSSLQAGEHMWEMWRDASPGMFFSVLVV